MMGWLTSWAMLLGVAVASAAPLLIGFARGGRSSGLPTGEALMLAAMSGFCLFVTLFKFVSFALGRVDGVSLVAAWIVSVAVGFGVGRRVESVEFASFSTLATPGDHAPSGDPHRRWQRIFFGQLCVMGALFILASAPLIRAEADSLFYWIAKAQTFVVSGDPGLFPYTHGATYPLAVPFANAAFLILGNMVGLGLWQMILMTGALLYAVRCLVARFGVPGLIVGAVCIVPQWIALPIVSRGLLLYADMALGASLLLASILLFHVLEGRRSMAWPAALVLAFFALTKVNALPYFLILFAAFSISIRGGHARGEGSDRRGVAAAGVWIFAPAGLCLILWGGLIALYDTRASGIAGFASRALNDDIVAAVSPPSRRLAPQPTSFL